jgi:diguanylate cyclase (GGDEF)-like protein
MTQKRWFAIRRTIGMMLILKSFSERISKNLHRYSATSQTGFDARTTFGLMVIGSVVLWPFAIYHLFSGNVFMTTIVGGLALLATANAILILRTEAAPPRLMLVSCVLTNITVLLAAFHLKLDGIFWVYPALVFNYSLVGTRVAVWANITLCTSVLYLAVSWAEWPLWPRIAVTMVATGFFSHIFSSNIDRQKQVLMTLATIDPLTGVRNRHELQLELMKACSQQTRLGTPVTLLVLDIDFFKKVNDTYGHIKGDDVLVEIARLLGKRLRATDSLFRYGGEEFLVLAGGATADGGRILAEDLRITIQNSRPCELSGISISLGVAQYAPPESISEWLHRADEALYRAKANGRNRVELASPGSS